MTSSDHLVNGGVKDVQGAAQSSSLPPAASLHGVSIQQRGRHFTDQYHRVVQLRGFNVSAASKVPTSPDGLKRIDAETWFDHRNVSFLGRPFPLDKAEFHFRRLLTWGYPFVRLLVTWEALSHAGPSSSDIDGDYIEYVRRLLLIADDVGMKVVICAHQDVWSRLCGGSGAPGWTFEAAGIDMRHFHTTKSAYVHNLDDDLHSGRKSKDPREISGPFVWPSGYQKLAASTLATLFWGGDIFASKCQTSSDAGQSVSIQTLLQESFFEAFGQLADAVGDIPSVLGFDVQNEPHRGLIGLHGWDNWCYETDLHIGHFPSLLQSLALGSGYKQNVPYYVKSWPFPTKVSHYSVVDPDGQSLWASQKDKKADECIWKQHDVWEWDDRTQKAKALRKDYFKKDPRPESDGRDIEWYRDCYAPFISKFAQRIRRKHSNLMLFFEPIPNEFMPPWQPFETLKSLTTQQRELLSSASASQSYAVRTEMNATCSRPSNSVYAPHFYDLNVLFSKTFNGWFAVNVQGLSRGMFLPRALYFGYKGVQKSYKKQIANMVRYARASLGEIPIIIGEIGIPFDINQRSAYGSKGTRSNRERYAKQSQLLDALAIGMEHDCGIAGWNWWNYNPDNEWEDGDYWNKEDFSVVCKDEVDVGSKSEDVYAGGRALDALVRPYAVRTAGIPLALEFDRLTGRFEFCFVESIKYHDLISTLSAEEQAEAEWTTLFLPQFHYDAEAAPYGIEVTLSDGTCEVDLERQTLRYRPAMNERQPGNRHSIVITRRSVMKSDSKQDDTVPAGATVEQSVALRTSSHLRIAQYSRGNSSLLNLLRSILGLDPAQQAARAEAKGISRGDWIAIAVVVLFAIGGLIVVDRLFNLAAAGEAAL